MTQPSWVSSARWQDEPKGEAHRVLSNVYRLLAEDARWKLDADEYHASLYAGAAGAAGVSQRSRRAYTYGPSTLPYNVCRRATDTLVAKVAKHRPLPTVLANRGDWRAQKRARKMGQFIEGAFYKYSLFERHARRIVRDAAIFRRGGWLKVARSGKAIAVERCHPWEILVDDWDGRYDEPRNLYHCRTMDRAVAIEQFARTAEGGVRRSVKAALDSAGTFVTTAESSYRQDRSQTVDRVDVLEAWHLCDDQEAHDAGDEHSCSGRHVVCTTAGTLVDESWTEPRFPFARLRYSDPLAGPDGMSLVEALEGFQYETNLMSERVSEGHETLGGAIVLVPDGSGIHTQQITNGIRVLMHKPGGTPQLFQPSPVHPAAYQRLHDLTSDAIAEVGLSQMSVEANRPPGITAAVAIHALDDIETERFVVFGRAYEAWCLDVARLLIAAVKSIAQDHGEFAVPVPMRDGVLRLNWSDVEIDGYELRVFSSSVLPQQPSARLEKLHQLFDRGIVDRSTFIRQLEATDLNAELDIETADKLLVDEMIEVMLDADESEGDGAFRTPHPYLDLRWAAKRAHQRLNKAMLEGVPEYNAELLRRFIAIAESMIPPEPAAEPAPPPAPDMGAAPIPPEMTQPLPS
jgi:hypothetical protein